MNLDPFTVACNAAALLIALGVLFAYVLLWRLLLPAAFILLCVSAYGWGLLALFLWFCADAAHRRDIAGLRVCAPP